MSKHTPGPWNVEAIHDDSGGHTICHVWAGEGYESPLLICEYAYEADARLIAAGPELLQALRECVASYERHRDEQPTGHLWPDPNHIFHARNALAKAEGGEG